MSKRAIFTASNFYGLWHRPKAACRSIGLFSANKFVTGFGNDKRREMIVATRIEFSNNDVKIGGYIQTAISTARRWHNRYKGSDDMVRITGSWIISHKVSL
jgi:hypothetical protein